MKEISFSVRDKGNRIEMFNHLCKFEGVNPDTVFARQSMDGISVNITMLLNDAQKVIDNPQCPEWLLELIDEASFTTA